MMEQGQGGQMGQGGQAQCVVCREQPPAAICAPCLHVCMCMRCASNVCSGRGACPLCKAPLHNVFSIRH